MKEKIKILAEYLEIDPEDIKEGYAKNVFEADGKEFYVGTEDEAYEAAKQEIADLYDDLGVELFSKDFQEWIYENALNEEKIDEIIDEEIEYFTTQDPDKEMIKMLEDLDTNSKKINYIKDLFDKNSFIKFVKEKDLIDLDKTIEKCIEEDGIAHTLASYDGKEVVLTDDLVAYRIS